MKVWQSTKAGLDRERNRRSRRGRLLMGIAAAAVLAAVLLCLRFFRAQAVFDRDGIHIDPAGEENSMLIIGTHLIHMHALTDELYQLAEASAADSSQTKRYYKSELADGRWMDITDASSLSDLMETGVLAEEEEIRALFLTHRTGADGITYDLRTGESVSVFDISPLYEVEALPELQPLNIQYDLLSQSATDAAGEKCRERIGRFFEETKPAQTDGGQMAALQRYYVMLCERGAPQEEKEMVSLIMGKADASRRAAVYEEVSAALQQMSDEMSSLPAGEGEEEGEKEGEKEEKDDTAYFPDQALLAAIQDSSQRLADSLARAEGNALEEGDTVMDGVRYRLALALIEDAAAGDQVSCDEDVRQLLWLQRIMQAEIRERAEELAFLERELLPAMEEAYADSLSQGVSPRYEEAVAANSSHVILEHMMSEDMAEREARRGELQFYIQAAAERMEEGAAAEYFRERMEQTVSFRRVIPEDAYAQAARTSVESHLLWLQTMLAQSGGGEGEMGLNRLYEEKAALQERMLEALDDLDPDLAQRLEVRIEEKERQIQDAARAQSTQLNRLYEEKAALEASGDRLSPETDSRIAALDVQIAAAAAGLTDGSEAAGIERMKQDAKKILQSGNRGNLHALETDLDGLIASLEAGSSLAGNALRELYGDMAAAAFLQDGREYEPLMEKTEAAIAENKDIIRTEGECLSPARAMDILEDALGGSLGIIPGDEASSAQTLSPRERLSAVMALADYAALREDEDLQRSAAVLAASLADDGSLFLFPRKNGMEAGMVSVQALAAYKGLRYIWDDTKKTAILAGADTWYQFTAFQKRVGRDTDVDEEMEKAAGYAGVLYLPPQYVADQFGCRAYDLTGTGYAVLTEEAVLSASGELTDLLLRSG